MLNNMPPFFFTMLAMMGIDIFSKKEATPVQPLGVSGFGNLYQNYLPSLFLPKFIKVFESGSFNAPTKYYAYPATPYEKSRGIYTIGNGSTLVYSNDRNFIRKVLPTDNLDILKVLTKNTHLNNEDFALKLTINHLLAGSRSTYLVIAKDLDNLGVLFDSTVAEHLYEFCYGSGSLNKKRLDTRNTFLNDIKIAQNSLQRHKAVLKWRLSYYIQDIQWNTAKGGWTTRALVVAKYFSNLITMEKIISQKSIYETNYNQKRIDLRTDFNISISI